MAVEPEQPVCTCGRAEKRTLTASKRKRIEAILTILETHFRTQRPTADARRKAMDFIRAFQHKVFCIPDLRSTEEYFRRLRIVAALAKVGNDHRAKREVADFFDENTKAAGTMVRLAKRRAETEAARKASGKALKP